MKFPLSSIAAALVVVSCQLTLSIPLAARRQSQSSCSSYKECSIAGKKALRKGKVALAISLFELQAAYAEKADVRLGHNYPGSGKALYPLATQAYNNLTLANMKKGNYVFARLWCLRALSWDSKNSVALRHQREIKRKLRNWKWPKTATGLYVQYAGNAIWQTLCVREKDPHQLQVSFLGYRALDEHTGELKGIFSLSDELAVYRGDKDFPKCRVRMRLSPGQAVLRQEGDCGFGYGVAASGTFRRVDDSPQCVMPQ